MKKTGNTYDVGQVSKESMLLRLLLTYWRRRVCILKVVMFLRKYHKTRYQELQHLKKTRTGVLLDYSEKTKESVTSLQNKSSAAIKFTIHRSSRSITSPNVPNSSEISGFPSASNITSESNSRSF